MAMHKLTETLSKQKERLAKRLGPMPESQAWLDELSDSMSFVQLEKGAVNISEVCDRARTILALLKSPKPPSDEDIILLVQEMREVDNQTLKWRQREEWSFRVMSRSEISSSTQQRRQLPERIEIHQDIWMAYEWNYHRTARMILHQQLLECMRQIPAHTIQTLSLDPEINATALFDSSISTIQTLANEILSTVPQCLCDVNRLGEDTRALPEQPCSQAVGAYLLLWPIKIIKSPTMSATALQKDRAAEVFERIRECTGMKSHLGILSCI